MIIHRNHDAVAIFTNSRTPELEERSVPREHSLEQRRLVGEPLPAETDPASET